MANRLFADCAKHLPEFSMNVVFDVGANIGQSTDAIIEHFPTAQVFAFEPVSATFAQFMQRFGDFPNVKANRLALSSRCAAGNVMASGTSVLNSLTEEIGTAENPVEPVDLLTGDVYCDQHGIEHISYLKVDTEGFDMEVLKGFHQMIGRQRIDLIQVEAAMNPLNERHVDLTTFRGYLEACNYYLFGIYGARHERKVPMLRRCNPVFISQRLLDANTRRRAKAER